MLQCSFRRLGNEFLFLSSSPSVNNLNHPSVLLSRVAETAIVLRDQAGILSIGKHFVVSLFIGIDIYRCPIYTIGSRYIDYLHKED